MSATTTPVTAPSPSLLLLQDAATLVAAVGTLLNLIASNETDPTLTTEIASAVAAIQTASASIVESTNILPSTFPLDI